MSVFIGGAWPYANGSLHLGHAAGLLPGDIIARYFRLAGEDVLYVSGSDCHGTPITIRASQEGVTPAAIADRYHAEFAECFKRLGFSYDLYTRTDDEFHHQTVQEQFKILQDHGFIYEKSAEQSYCEKCSRFLPDRFVEGTCPRCGGIARGDQCDHCSALLDPLDLLDRKCKICGTSPVTKSTRHLFLALSKFQQELEAYVSQAKGWRENAIHLTKRYLNEGLQDRAVTRDLSWGVEVPVDGFRDKKVYVWVDAVLGYLSASKQWAAQTGGDWKKFWSSGATAYYVHGKDNIPFHTVILPALLLGDGTLTLPGKVISSEYLTIEGKKLSTSNHWAVWVPDILDRYNPDAFRYFLTINGPEKRDTDFSWREFVTRNNSELLGAFGNFVNRSLIFIEKYFEAKVPDGACDAALLAAVTNLYGTVGERIAAGEVKSAIELIFAFIRTANKYFDDRQPWIQVKEDLVSCRDTLYTCVQIIANLSNLLSPFLPFTCDTIRGFLGIEAPCWKYLEISSGSTISKSRILFERLDKEVVELEVAKLGKEQIEQVKFD